MSRSPYNRSFSSSRRGQSSRGQGRDNQDPQDFPYENQGYRDRDRNSRFSGPPGGGGGPSAIPKPRGGTTRVPR